MVLQQVRDNATAHRRFIMNRRTNRRILRQNAGRKRAQR